MGFFFEAGGGNRVLFPGLGFKLFPFPSFQIQWVYLTFSPPSLRLPLDGGPVGANRGFLKTEALGPGARPPPPPPNVRQQAGWGGGIGSAAGQDDSTTVVSSAFFRTAQDDSTTPPPRGLSHIGVDGFPVAGPRKRQNALISLCFCTSRPWHLVNPFGFLVFLWFP